jgi:hypothetical protein
LPAVGIGVEELDAGLPVRGRVRHADAGAIDQHVERSEGREYISDRIPAVRGLRHIGRDLAQASSKDRLGAQPFEATGIHIDRGKHCARRGERACHRPAHAACCAGDEDGSPRKHLLF